MFWLMVLACGRSEPEVQVQLNTGPRLTCLASPDPAPCADWHKEAEAAGRDEESRAALSAMCDRGSPLGCAALGTRLADLGRFEEADRLLGQACDKELGVACDAWGISAQSQKLSNWRELAIDRHQRACDLRIAAGCHNGGVAALPVDCESAYRLFGRGCELDAADSCSQFGALLYNETCQPNSKVEAIQAFERGCQLRDAQGCSNLALVHQASGDLDSQRRAASRACELGATQHCAADRP